MATVDFISTRQLLSALQIAELEKENDDEFVGSLGRRGSSATRASAAPHDHEDLPPSRSNPGSPE
ncbi:hypothetical protein Pyn_31233 [Prunus yedoensis var. nudiflora]|uniref:Uncharacterized protein n=1 Tax=Prunus yedoensis var. nudiflora TaxID=2094558 RepID=A0A314YEI3_PRUYE|nr:hypothetical protein Pyn_31233 [Prunus yedoensis var. nudiflora]